MVTTLFEQVTNDVWPEWAKEEYACPGCNKQLEPAGYSYKHTPETPQTWESCPPNMWYCFTCHMGWGSGHPPGDPNDNWSSHKYGADTTSRMVRGSQETQQIVFPQSDMPSTRSFKVGALVSIHLRKGEQHEGTISKVVDPCNILVKPYTKNGPISMHKVVILGVS